MDKEHIYICGRRLLAADNLSRDSFKAADIHLYVFAFTVHGTKTVTDWSCIQENSLHDKTCDRVHAPESKFTQFRALSSSSSFFSFQDQVTGTTTTTVLKNLEPNTEYTVTVVPVYHEMEGKSQSANGKTSESTWA